MCHAVPRGTSTGGARDRPRAPQFLNGTFSQKDYRPIGEPISASMVLASLEVIGLPLSLSLPSKRIVDQYLIFVEKGPPKIPYYTG